MELPRGCIGHATVGVSNGTRRDAGLLVLGGLGSPDQEWQEGKVEQGMSAYLYDARADTGWTRLQVMPTERAGLGACALVG